ncbi:hypothetical protein P9X10_02490 [Bacillus cereus]|nr:hypothetical protein [Bacillus cereus]
MSSYTEEQLNEAVDLYVNKEESGLRLWDIVRQTKIPPNKLYEELKVRGIEKLGKTKKYEYPNLIHVKELYLNKDKNGLSVHGISRKLDVPLMAVYRELERLGLKGKPRGSGLKYTKEQLETAVHLYANKSETKMSVSKISKQTGVTPTAIYKELNARYMVKGKIEGIVVIPSMEDKLEKAVELYKNREENGLSLEGITMETRLNPNLLYEELERLGISFKE